MAQSQASSVAASWEGWIELRTYHRSPDALSEQHGGWVNGCPTRKPGDGARLYGAAEELALSQTVSDKPSAPEQGTMLSGWQISAPLILPWPEQDSVIDGEGGRAWDCCHA